MKKTLITIAVLLMLGISASAQIKTTKVVTDSVAFHPSEVTILQGVSSKGNPTYWIELPTASGVRKVTMSQSHATSNRLLALIERMDEKGKYTYSIKFAQKKSSSTSEKADLSGFKRK